MREPAASDERLGELLQELVNRISHLQGKTLSVLNDESVTLPQVLLLRRLSQLDESTPSDLAELMRMSLPAVSQMLERLFQLELVTRAEAAEDRRKKKVMITRKARVLLERVRKARSSEYAAGIAGVSPKLRSELAKILGMVLEELPEEVQAVALSTTRAAFP